MGGRGAGQYRALLHKDQAVADRWGRIAPKALAAKSPLSVIDGLLVATAMQHHLALVTRNTRDVAVTEVAVFNPWNREHSQC